MSCPPQAKRPPFARGAWPCASRESTLRRERSCSRPSSRTRATTASAYDLIHFANQALGEGDLPEAVRLYGASVSWCERHGFDLRGYNYFFRERDLALLRESLGQSEYEKGYSLGYNEDPARILSHLFARYPLHSQEK